MKRYIEKYAFSVQGRKDCINISYSSVYYYLFHETNPEVALFGISPPFDGAPCLLDLLERSESVGGREGRALS